MLNPAERELWAQWREFTEKHSGNNGVSHDVYPGAGTHFLLSKLVDLQDKISKLEREKGNLTAALNTLDREWQKKLEQRPNCCGGKHGNKPD